MTHIDHSMLDAVYDAIGRLPSGTGRPRIDSLIMQSTGVLITYHDAGVMDSSRAAFMTHEQLRMSRPPSWAMLMQG